MGLESYPKEVVRPVSVTPENLVYVMEPGADEIDIGDLVSKLAGEWKLMLAVLIGGLLISTAGTVYLTRSHAITSIIRAPAVNELADVNAQRLVEVDPQLALERYVDQLLSVDLQLSAFKQSRLFRELSQKSDLAPEQIFSNIREDMSVDRVKHAYYELEKKEKTPFKEISLKLVSSEPELAAEYVELLIGRAQEEAVQKLTNDINSTRTHRIEVLQEQLQSLGLAANANRMAEIRRLEEINREKINGLKMQIELQVNRARKNRENQIVRVREALAVAETLEIVNPVTWEDLRSNRIASQITNEFGGADKTQPDYFQGTRILSAELKRLESRKDDRPFIPVITDLEKQILELENDPKIAALKARTDDTIYVEKYDELQRALSELQEMPSSYGDVQLAIVTQQPIISPDSTRNGKMILLAGLIISGFVALLIALVRISVRKKAATVTA